MVRFVIIGVILAVAFMLYALVDAAMSNPSRARGVSKPIWVVLIVVLPVLGGVLWFTVGRGRGAPAAPAQAPDDDPRFTGKRLSDAELDAHVRELEDRLRELDEETFPGEQAEQAVLPPEPEQPHAGQPHAGQDQVGQAQPEPVEPNQAESNQIEAVQLDAEHPDVTDNSGSTGEVK